MPKKYFRKYLPSHASIKEHRFIRFFGPILKHHNMWHLNRHSVAGGVAVGLFAGLVPGPLQVLTSVILTFIFRVNLPVAILATFYTNPFTILPIYYVAYHYGKFITGLENSTLPTSTFNPMDLPFSQWIPATIDWMVAAGKPFVVGLVLLAITLAIVGYFSVRGLWRVYIVMQWKQRQRRRMRKTASPP